MTKQTLSTIENLAAANTRIWQPLAPRSEQTDDDEDDY